MSKKDLEVIIATDCGSTTTKAILIEKKGDTYRQTFRGEAPTTVEAPFEDVTKGVLNSITEVEELSGRKILDGEKIITPNSGNTGVDIYVSTSSAGGGLQQMIEELIKHGAQVRLCRTCAVARGLGEATLIPGVTIGTLAELAEVTLAADKVITF